MLKPPLGGVSIGTRLLVIPANWRNRNVQEPVLAVVTKVGRAWIDLSEENGLRTWRMRLDTQNDGRDSNYRDRFVTPAQYEWERRSADAREVLREAMVDVYRGPWGSDDRLLALADFIRTYNQQHPEENR